ncbi:MAG: hypothetical protein JWN86_4719 [Planctomycetota bacterium]|nr:hypothetical protein [Planctomycetota bacterium]
MRVAARVFLLTAFTVVIGQALGVNAARAQGLGSLGGYGGSMTEMGTGPGMSGTVIPYAGNFGGFMPYRMSGGGGDLSFRSRGTPPTNSARSSFALSSMSAGSSSMAGGMGTGFGARASMISPPGTMAPRGRGIGMGVMPPNLGYPFRQPPSLLSPASAGMGMGM